MVSPDRASLTNNVAGNPAGDQTWELDARNIMFRVDHNFTPNFRASHSFYWNRRPSIRNCGEVAGCTVEFDPETESAKNTDYYGNGFFQRISTHHAHQQFDWIISNNLMNHSTVAYDRWFMGGNHLAAGANWPQRLWEGTSAPSGGIRDTTAGPPCDHVRRQHPLQRHRRERLAGLRLPGEQPLAVLERPDVGEGPALAEDRLRVPPPRFPVPRLGGRIRRRPIQLQSVGHGGYDASGNSLGPTGDPFASFLLGQVQDAQSDHSRACRRSARRIRESG